MKKLLKSGNVTLYFYMAVLLVMAGLWRAGEAINAELGNLPVKVAPKIGNNARVLSEKSFYPVWVKQSVASTSVATDSHQVDSLFKRDEEKVAQVQVQLAEPDYGYMFRQVVRIDGVADDGLFINGHFYPTGTRLEAFAMLTSTGKRLVPVLEAWQGGKASFRVGAQKISIRGKE